MTKSSISRAGGLLVAGVLGALNHAGLNKVALVTMGDSSSASASDSEAESR